MTTKQRYLIRGQLNEVFIVTEYRDGCVYKTESVGLVVCNRESGNPLLSGMLNSISTKMMKEIMEKRDA